MPNCRITPPPPFPPPLLNNRRSSETELCQRATHVTPTKHTVAQDTKRQRRPAHTGTSRQASGVCRPSPRERGPRPHATANEEAANAQRPSGTTARAQSSPVSPGQPPRVPHQTQNQRASAHHNTKPKKAWTPDPQQCGSGVGQRTIARHTATQTASNISAGQSLLYRQLPGGPPPAHTGSANAERKRPTHDNYNTGAAMEPKNAGKCVSIARAQSSPVTPGQHSETRNRPKSNGPALTPILAPEDRLTPQKKTTPMALSGQLFSPPRGKIPVPTDTARGCDDPRSSPSVTQPPSVLPLSQPLHPTSPRKCVCPPASPRGPRPWWCVLLPAPEPSWRDPWPRHPESPPSPRDRQARHTRRTAAPHSGGAPGDRPCGPPRHPISPAAQRVVALRAAERPPPNACASGSCLASACRCAHGDYGGAGS